jgi:hypothetical protein
LLDEAREMATYHFSVKDKPKGYATAHFLYIARLEQYQHVRSDSQEVLEHVELGGCMPSWVNHPAEFWQAADSYERKNAKVYMEYEFALPNECTPEQRKTLVETFLNEHIVKHQYPYSYAIHSVKSRLDAIDQPHCHLMFSLRADDGIDRNAEQYFKRYNPKSPEKGGVRKKQLQEGFENFSDFLMDIRKQWENHLNTALQSYVPTVTYQVGKQVITVPNRVSASSYENYNLKHGTFYLPEPKLGTGQQNETPEYLEKIKTIREHNQREYEIEILQQQKELLAEPHHLYAIDDQPYNTIEVDYLVEAYLDSNTEVSPDEIATIYGQQDRVEQIYANVLKQRELASIFEHKKDDRSKFEM